MDEIFSQFLENSDIKVTISMFKEKHRVDIRKYWDDKGEMKPGQKGINMTIDEFNKLIAILPAITERIADL